MVRTCQEKGQRARVTKNGRFTSTVPGKRRRGRQKTRWKDSCKRDMESAGLKEEDVLDRTKWNNDTQYHSSDPR